MEPWMKRTNLQRELMATLNSCGVELGPRGFIVLTVNPFVCHFEIPLRSYGVAPLSPRPSYLYRPAYPTYARLLGSGVLGGDGPGRLRRPSHVNFTRVRSWSSALYPGVAPVPLEKRRKAKTRCSHPPILRITLKSM